MSVYKRVCITGIDSDKSPFRYIGFDGVAIYNG